MWYPVKIEIWTQMGAMTFVLYGIAVIDSNSHQQAKSQLEHLAMSYKQRSLYIQSIVYRECC